jgi:predicted RNase H-like nuclease
MPSNQNLKPLSQMTSAELCEEANSLRTSMSDLAERLNTIYSQLHITARRAKEEGVSIYAYLSVANVGKRFAGMVMQASRRSSIMESRLKLALQRETEEKAQQSREEIRKRNSLERKQRELEERADPLEALYGVMRPKTEADPDLIDSELIPKGDLSSDLNDLYGEEPV